ncbi:uncharacterized protein LOC119583759 isoform X2 [Penaeus monodon]|uniref:uncharacterized protein LOC119583759 isoform X2 n=1 Tax=Penaeus monodon TaxID=6687 RepID=UPI0018A75940|nr:uncharacterized protein LOC119583759 isoform X2 [Penaeus monodon]
MKKAECRDNYCMCKNDGDFYEFSYCEIPYIGYEVTLQIAIIVCIVIAMCLLLASVYSIINVRRLRDLRELARQRRGRRTDSETEVPSSTVIAETLHEDRAEATATRDSASDHNASTPGSSREAVNEADVAEVHGTEHQAHIQHTTLVVRGNGHSEVPQEQFAEGSRPQDSEEENDPEEVNASVSHIRESQGIQTRF